MNQNSSSMNNFSDQGMIRYPMSELLEAGQQLQRKVFTSNATPMTLKILFVQHTPATFFLTDIHNPDYRLTSPLQIEIERSDSGVVVSDAQSGVYGAGKNQKEAIEDFQSMFVVMFEQLSEQETNLSKALSDRLNYLRSALSRR